MQKSNLIPLSITLGAIEHITKQSKAFQTELLKFIEECCFYKSNNYGKDIFTDFIIVYSMFHSVTVKLTVEEGKKIDFELNIDTSLNFTKQLQYAVI